MRFHHNAVQSKPSVPGPLQATEPNEAKLYWLRLVQQTAFPSELRACRRGQPHSSSSRVLTLQPDIDEDGLLRVGGRLHELDSPDEMITD
ncbi:hypothetical protein HPB48_012144 [Haemaphysalis longicornis]|uniref:Uncharacterized protein n=1 Tax=Haemaphysalis longicornis TaxID=44386 RepID=A0A9J6GA83_HAELO|nr:hypothetical protein HPB48_012144 [Haemaphysalis longicornis]